MTPTPEHLALLRAAYPDGHLSRRGVLTVGGWTCFRERKPRLYLEPRGVTSYGFPFCSDAADACERGDLLPDLDDPLTFYAGLLDLAEALGWPTDDHATLFWRLQCDSHGRHEDAWQLGRMLSFPQNRDLSHYGATRTIYVGKDDADPIEALLLARASLRGKEAAP